jgi:hypothetical protein
MQRCSQCDFIYEDDQRLCDMDGHELVYEPTIQSLQRIAAGAADRVPPPPKSRSGRPAILAASAVLIGAVLSVGYSGFTSDYAPPNTKAPSAEVILTPLPEPVPTPAMPAVNPTPSSSDSPRLEETRPKPTIATPLARSTSRNRSTATRRETVRPQANKASNNESGIGGFLKKTGKILKKPFKRL